MVPELPAISSLAFLFSPANGASREAGSNSHAPILRWLVGAVSPRILVDLAPPSCGSFDVFCESVAHWKLATRAVGIGDRTGALLAAGDIAQQPVLGPAGELLDMAAAAAADQFRSGSVDLLHLCPVPEQEQLIRLYEAWLPKLSPRAVVALGGIVARRGAAGGARELWHRLRAAHPQVSFEQGGGLGIAAAGSNSSGAIKQLTSLPYHRLQSALAVFEGERHGPRAVANGSAQWQQPDLDEPTAAMVGRVAQLEQARRLESERAERAEFELRQIRQTSTWRIVHALRHPKTLIGWRKDAVTVASTPGMPAAADRRAALRQALDERFRQFLNGSDRISFARFTAPRVSVVIPVWNQAALTLACLQSLLLPRGVAMEVVIVDNASTDESARLFARLDGVTVISNRENVGFLHAVNQGVEASRGKHVLLLNNDAMLRPGSLEAAVETLEGEPDIGAVGGPIILPEGMLQEAGSIIWADGSCAGYGRGRPPGEPEFQFRRDVDYCSGAFLLIPRRCWNELGGFDPAYSPAYYEEADFCMRLRQKGLRVVYEPRAVIDHLEFGSTDTSTWTGLQIRNAVTFRQKHAAALSQFHCKHGTPLLRARARAAKQRVLVIDDAVPHPSLGVGLPRAQQIIATLAASGRDVTLLPLGTIEDEWERVYDTLPATVEVMLGVGRSGLAAFLDQRRGHYDVVLVSRPHNMSMLREACAAAPGCLDGALLVYDAEALFSARDLMKSRLAGERFSQEAVRARIEAEAALAGSADRILAVSEQEAAQFRKLKATRVLVLPHTVSVRPTPRPWTERSGLLFVGRLSEEGSPNVDSLRWFCREVLPRIRAADYGTEELYVAGKADALLVKPCPGGRLLGEVADLWDLYDRCRVFVAPTRFAAGIPHKVHEAAAHGIPVVATSLLARQLGWQDERDLLVAGDPKQFADCTRRLMADQGLWQRLRISALQRVREDCSERQFRATLEKALTVGPEASPAGMEAVNSQAAQ